MSGFIARHKVGAFAAALAAVAAGCGTDDTEGVAGGVAGEVDFTADTGPAAVENAQPHVVAQVTTSEGAELTFYGEPAAGDDPVISVAIASTSATPTVDAVLAQNPSALELFVALAPGKAAPDELVREHRLLAQVDAAYAAEPRRLAGASVVGSHAVDSFVCAGNYAGWLASFTAWAPPLDGSYTGLDSGASSGYVGYAPKFYFDVCRTTSSIFAYAVRTERRSNSGAAWSVFDDGSPLGVNQRYRFFRNSFTCSSFQYRLFVEPVGGSYYRGATWAKEWSCVITG